MRRRHEDGVADADEQEEEDAAGIGDPVEELGHGDLRGMGIGPVEACGRGRPPPRPAARWFGVHPGGETRSDSQGTPMRRRNGASVRSHGPAAVVASTSPSPRLSAVLTLLCCFGEGIAAAQRRDRSPAPLVDGAAAAGPGGRAAVAAAAARWSASSASGCRSRCTPLLTGTAARACSWSARLGQPVRAGRLRLAAAAGHRARRRGRLRWSCTTVRPAAWRAGAEAAWSAALWDLLLFVPAAGGRLCRRRPAGADRSPPRSAASSAAGDEAGRRRGGAGPDRPGAARRRSPTTSTSSCSRRWPPPVSSTTTRTGYGNR